MQTTAEVSRKYYVLTNLSTRTYENKYVYSLKCLRVNTDVETVARSLKGQVKLVLLWGFAECGNRKALRLKAQGVYSCK